ncbi:hypothetical protein Gorai_021752 [Gossypium raimondii]|uniref:Uncharacterized protein n=1 Tax=Gossypium raimondii TaxID=29730 RepID=A0A7J8NR68_GOSRA|nr:hypothetical protein [Gossypium raimondii]
MEDFSPSIASNERPGFALEKELERVTEKVYNKEGVDVQEVAGSDDVSVMYYTKCLLCVITNVLRVVVKVHYNTMFGKGGRFLT